MEKQSKKGWAVFNPHDKPVEELPVIYGFNNGGSFGFMDAVLVAEDGVILGGHLCSSEGFMPNDLGILEGSRPDRHKSFEKHYPNGYRMEFVGYEEFSSHEGPHYLYESNKMQTDNQSTPITGNFIKLFSEGYFNFSEPTSTPVAIEDIAVGLSNTCRFAGQLDKFYSVAEHSIHCLHVATELGCSIDDKRAVFMHDSAEAFVGDVPSPLKIMLPGYKEIENQVEEAIFDQFGITLSPIVKQIDLMLLRAEKEMFMGGQDEWHCLDGVKDCSGVIDIQCMTPRRARSAFLFEAHQLGLIAEYGIVL